MFAWLRYFQLDRTSFWLGFFAGALLWWILGRLRPLAGRGLHALQAKAQAARRELLVSTENRLANDTLRQAQRMHLAAPLFSLDEILVAPGLLAPPPPVEPGAPPIPEDITTQAVPYLPDWPELAAAYRAPTLSLAEALQGGANLALLGRPGSGKTVALAHLATLMARHDPTAGPYASRTPLLVHAADLALPPDNPQDPLAVLIEAVSDHASPLTLPRLPGFLRSICADGQALLLLDGLDECSPVALQNTVEYLGELLRQNPKLQAAAAASPDNYAGLVALGFAPVSLAAWNEDQRAAFIQQWGSVWNTFIKSPNPAGDQAVDPALLSAWLLCDTATLSPLELALKSWAAHAGDALGSGPAQAVEAYLRRMTAGLPGALPALQHLAGQMAASMQPVVGRKDAESWASEALPAQEAASLAPDEPAAQPSPSRTAKGAATEAPPSRRALAAMLENGLLIAHSGERLSFAHPLIAGYAAACSLPEPAPGEGLLSQPDWTGKSLALKYQASHSSQAAWLPDWLASDPSGPLLRRLFAAARWLPDVPENTPWRAQVMRQLAANLQEATQPLGLQARALAALAILDSPGVNVLFHQALASALPGLRQLAALGCGMRRDAKASAALVALLGDPMPDVRRAACLALVAIGDKPALEAVATTLLQGDEDLRRAAAEALANDPDEGYPTLKEGSVLEDLLVRRAVVYGLARIRQPWAAELLQKMQVDDSQWVVKNAAGQALDELSQPNPRLPRPLPERSETAWLIAYAGEKGIGIAPGKPALDLVLRALQEGALEQRLAALYDLGRRGDERSLPAVYQAYSSGQGELREAAFEALRQINAAGQPIVSV
ncbi:MAG TPA: HEAT repeat domain-containing protein [Anaerolineales bacterium]